MKKLLIILLLIIATCGLIILTSVVFFAPTRSMNAPSGVDEGQVPPATLTESTVFASGKQWIYRLDETMKVKLAIIVAPAPSNSGNPDAILSIGGTGCNNMVAFVTSSKPDSPQAERSIGGKTYFLTQTTSTSMACDNSKAGFDDELNRQIKVIFDSLSVR